MRHSEFSGSAGQPSSAVQSRDRPEVNSYSVPFCPKIDAPPFGRSDREVAMARRQTRRKYYASYLFASVFAPSRLPVAAPLSSYTAELLINGSARRCTAGGRPLSRSSRAASRPVDDDATFDAVIPNASAMAVLACPGRTSLNQRLLLVRQSPALGASGHRTPGVQPFGRIGGNVGGLRGSANGPTRLPAFAKIPRAARCGRLPKPCDRCFRGTGQTAARPVERCPPRSTRGVRICRPAPVQNWRRPSRSADKGLRFFAAGRRPAKPSSLFAAACQADHRRSGTSQQMRRTHDHYKILSPGSKLRPEIHSVVNP